MYKYCTWYFFGIPYEKLLASSSVRGWDVRTISQYFTTICAERYASTSTVPFEKLFVVNKKISFNLNIIFLNCYVFAYFQFFVFNRSRK